MENIVLFIDYSFIHLGRSLKIYVLGHFFLFPPSFEVCLEFCLEFSWRVVSLTASFSFAFGVSLRALLVMLVGGSHGICPAPHRLFFLISASTRSWQDLCFRLTLTMVSTSKCGESVWDSRWGMSVFSIWGYGSNRNLCCTEFDLGTSCVGLTDKFTMN